MAPGICSSVTRYAAIYNREYSRGTGQNPITETQSLIRPVMPELDSIRGIAVLGVVFLHGFAWQYGGLHFSRPASIFLAATQPGSLGVNLFFVLSGFLITGVLVDSKPAARFYARFYSRRALRILPAYYALLLSLLFLHSSGAKFLLLSFVYLSNLTNIFGVSCDYGPLWSLAVEEHFYLAWPLVVRKLSVRALIVTSIAIMLVVPALRAVCFTMNWGKGYLSWYTWFVADGLATGSLLATVLRSGISRQAIRKWCALLLGISICMGLIGARFGIGTRQRLLGAALQETTVNLFFAGVLLFFLLVGTSTYKRYVNSSLLRFFGYISYGLYLDHLLAFRLYDRLAHSYWPTLIPSNDHFGLVLSKFLVAGTLGVGVAYLSRKYFEGWFLKLKDGNLWKRGVPCEVSITTQSASSLPAAS